MAPQDPRRPRQSGWAFRGSGLWVSGLSLGPATVHEASYKGRSRSEPPFQGLSLVRVSGSLAAESLVRQVVRNGSFLAPELPYATSATSFLGRGLHSARPAPRVDSTCFGCAWNHVAVHQTALGLSIPIRGFLTRTHQATGRVVGGGAVSPRGPGWLPQTPTGSRDVGMRRTSVGLTKSSTGRAGFRKGWSGVERRLHINVKELLGPSSLPPIELHRPRDVDTGLHPCLRSVATELRGSNCPRPTRTKGNFQHRPSCVPFGADLGCGGLVFPIWAV
ncbi:hypothetical protein GWK47_000601 [Chionoecetes opilio]|uniref:Uncharacterized protein n=1 Tax=Chionoecetes opilio TaxID=41210 RepID=A0A8J5CV84_CHIOP|nr:hypothetical protein GWK47_000601 [Chionoecetes opilio]